LLSAIAFLQSSAHLALRKLRAGDRHPDDGIQRLLIVRREQFGFSRMVLHFAPEGGVVLHHVRHQLDAAVHSSRFLRGLLLRPGILACDKQAAESPGHRRNLHLERTLAAGLLLGPSRTHYAGDLLR